VTSGLSVVALLSLAALAAGLLLLASGAWLLIRATPGWWRLAAIPLAFLVLQFVLLPLAGAAYGTHPPRTPLSATKPAGARGVSFGTLDGVTLEAWYTPSRNGAVIILLPGSGGDKGSTVAHAAILVEHGYGVLALDSRGTGESGGSGNAWGWHGTADVAGAMAWLREQPEVDPGRIGALGLSMGGEVAVTAAASEAGLAAVVAEGISARVPADLAYLPDDVSGVIQRLDGEIMWAVADLMTDAVMPMPLPEAVAAVGVPTMIIVGASADERAAAPILTAAAPALQVWDLPETPHILSLERHPDEWKTRVIGFLDESLAP
jgi:dienelactone hydrolase